DPVEVARYVDRGYRIIDPHLHTSASHDVIPSEHVSPMRLYDYMLGNGWGFVTFTDHDTMAAYRRVPVQNERLVRGVEIKIKPNRIGQHAKTHALHVNVYMLTDQQFETLEAIAGTGDFYAFIDYLKGEKLRYAFNHPFWHEAFEKPNWETIAEILKGGYFPLIEYNWGRIPEQNQRSWMWRGSSGSRCGARRTTMSAIRSLRRWCREARSRRPGRTSSPETPAWCDSTAGP